jgi:ABC-2 type transport system permease protein
MMGMVPPEQKGNIEALWRMLGIRLVRASQGMRQQASRPGQGDEIVWQPFTAAVWQSYNPYPRVREFPESVVFANVNAEGGEGTFNSLQPAVSGLYEVAFMAPGAIDERADSDKPDEAKKLVVTPLVRLGTDTSILSMERLRSGGASASVLLKEITDPQDDRIQRIPLRPEDEKFFAEAGRLKTGEDYVLAARIQSEELVENASADSGDSSIGIDVIVVSDIDVLDRLWISVRNVPDRDINFQFQNVALVLNLLDVLAGDERFVNIRKRQANYASLRLIEDRVRVAETRTVEEIDAFEQEINELRSEAAQKRKENVAKLQAEVDELERAGQLDSRRMREARQKLEWQQQRNKEEAENEGERLVRRLRENLLQNRRELELDKLSIQNQIKVLAVMFPPIAPLFVGVIVFVARRLREREGVSKERLR